LVFSLFAGWTNTTGAQDIPDPATSQKTYEVKYGQKIMLTFKFKPTVANFDNGVYNVYTFGPSSLIIEARCWRGEAPLFVAFPVESGASAQMYTIRAVVPR